MTTRWPGLAGLMVVFALGFPGSARADDSYDCVIQPQVDVRLSANVAGVVDQVKVKRGDTVKSGQTVVRLAATVERAAYELAKARAEFAQRHEDRNTDLVEEQLISSDEKDRLETNAQLANLEMRQAHEVLRLRTIRSPIAGTVVDVRVDPGERVGQEEVARIAQLDPLEVAASVPVALYGSVAAGGVAIVLPESPFDEDREAHVTSVDPVIDEVNGTFGVRLELPNPEHKLPAGLKCSVTFPSP